MLSLDIPPILVHVVVVAFIVLGYFWTLISATLFLRPDNLHLGEHIAAQVVDNILPWSVSANSSNCLVSLLLLSANDLVHDLHLVLRHLLLLLLLDNRLNLGGHVHVGPLSVLLPPPCPLHPLRVVGHRDLEEVHRVFVVVLVKAHVV